MLNIIGGKNKRTELLDPKKDVRPTSSLKREAIFSTLESHAVKNSYNLYKDKCFIDLFAGSGAMGLEAVSRGAKNCFFYENNINVLDILEKNCNKICNDNNFQIINEDINNGNIYQTNIPISVIFIDPPYKIVKFDNILEKIKNLSDFNYLSLIVIESHKDTILDNVNEYKVIIEKIFNKTKISFLQLYSN